MAEYNNVFRSITEKKYNAAMCNAQELLHDEITSAGEKSLEFASELGTGKLGKLLRYKK